MALVESNEELNCVPLSFEERTGHLPGLLGDLIDRLRMPATPKASFSLAAHEHGKLRRQQGYTAAMMVEESPDPAGSVFSGRYRTIFPAWILAGSCSTL